MTIANAPLIETPKGTDKVPASDGSNQPRSLSLDKILAFIRTQGGGGGGSGIMPPMTFNEYDEIEEKEYSLYFIVNTIGELDRVYYKGTLIARKRTDGESISLGFPIVLPIIFG